MTTEQQTAGSAKVSAAPIYEERVLSTTIHLSPKYLNNINLNDIIQQTLKQKVEGRCISDGYIRPDSVTILSRNMGCMENHDFSGSITYTLKYKADICSPKEGQIIECVVDTHDETNSVCYVGDSETSPVEIYLFREHYLGNAEYAALKKGKKIMVKVLEPHIEFGSEKVLISAVYLGSA